MTNKQFLQQFGHFIDAPNGIQKLREMVLQLAVQGKVENQIATDNWSAAALELQQIDTIELPYSIPSSWKVAKLGDLGSWGSGGTPTKSNPTYYNGDIPWLVIADLNDGIVTEARTHITQAGLDNSSAKLVEPETLLIAMYGSIGKLGITGITCCTNQAIAFCKPNDQLIELRFLFHVVKASQSRLIFQGKGLAQQNISQKVLKAFHIGLPPLAEQYRIVAKIDELMALCDQLEAERNTREATHQRLIRAVHHPMTESADASATQTAWHRIRDNFADLYTTLESVQALRQTILQLAVQGKLVPQDPNDETATSLMNRLLARKKQLIREKLIKKTKELPPVTSEEELFTTPNNWVLTRFSVFADEIATGPFGSMVHKSDYITGGTPLINPSHMINGEIVPDDSISVSKEKARELESYKLYTNDIVMARRGEMGRCALVSSDGEGWLCGTGSFVLRFHKDVNRRFILLLFSSEFVRTYLGGNSVGTTMTNLNHGILNKMPVAVPPVAEQHRIVAKVDELMAFCDQLEGNIRDKNDTATHYAEAIVQQIAAA